MFWALLNGILLVCSHRIVHTWKHSFNGTLEMFFIKYYTGSAHLHLLSHTL